MDETAPRTLNMPGFGFDPDHVVDMRVEMASEREDLPADWPASIVRRAAATLKRDVEKWPITVGGADRAWQSLAADAWEHQADDMADQLAHLHAAAGPVGWVVQDEHERAHYDWTATLRAALVYLREDAPAVNQ